jgi:hypothetical protein
MLSSKSNHTCDIQVVNSGSKIQEKFRAINACLDQTDKVLLALLDKESLLEYLSDVPIGCMPAVLAFLHRNAINDRISNPSRQSTSFCFEMTPSHILNMLYSSMRWNMPSLYSFNGYIYCIRNQEEAKF